MSSHISMINPYLAAAYIATWTIHITYLVILARKYSRLRREIQEIESKPRGEN
jgi:hypothetical protein